MKFLNDLYSVILSRRNSNVTHSYTAQLLKSGTAGIAQKLGEEAVETIIESLRSDRPKLRQESADLLYHLLVLWADQGITPEEVEAVLEQRHQKR